MKFDKGLPLEIFIILLLVGIATFMIGMNMMSSSLKKVSGGGVKRLFKKTENNVLASVGIGAAATALVQSSAATSVMAIGFISAGVMTVFQGAGTILGAYLGTTITGVLASFSGFSISTYLLLLAVVGVVLTFFKHELVKNIGGICCGLGLLFFGLGTMSAVFKDCEPIKNAVANFCINVEGNPIGPVILWLAGVILTALFQSSSATSGIVIVMVGSGSITFASGMYLILGATVGTVITTILASIGGNTNVKRVTFIAIANRLICSLIGLSIVWPLANEFTNIFSEHNFGSLTFALAMFLVLYNVVFLIIWIPLLRPISDLVERLIRDKDSLKKKQALKFIDDHLLETPTLAMMQVKREIKEMFNNAQTNFELGYHLLIEQNFKDKNEIAEREDQIDFVNNAVSEYLINLSNRVSNHDERIVGSYFHMINDIERIGDHAYNFYETAEKMVANDLKFSDQAKGELQEMHDTIINMFVLARKMFHECDEVSLKELHNLETRTDELSVELANAHYERITKKACNVELSPFYSTFVSELERVADHIVNIGYLFVNPTGEDTNETK